jgi:PRTRC genetic system protein E
MSLITTLAPLLANASRVTLTLSRATGGGVAILVTTVLDPKDTESTDPIIAPLVAALARPLYLEAPTEEADATLQAALRDALEIRQGAAMLLEAYKADLAEQQNQARAAMAAKQSEAKNPKGKAKAGKAAPVSTITGTAASDQGDAGEEAAADDGTDDEEKPATPSATGPREAEAATSLFD